MHHEILLTGTEDRGYWPWPSKLFGHLVSGFQETAFNVVPVYRSKQAKGCPRFVPYVLIVLRKHEIYLHFIPFLNTDIAQV